MLAAALLAGCVSERHKALVMIPEGAFAPRDEGAGDPRPGLPDERAPRTEATSLAGMWVPPESRIPRPPDAAPEAPAQDVPREVAGPYAGHRPLADGVSLEQAMRERFLTSATRVEAEKATLHVPPALAREATLTGAQVVEEGPGRRVATGNAVLTLRRLTVRAARLTLVARDDGAPDVSLSARGRVSFHADLPASVIDERDLKSLLLRNDGYTPLR